jgi:hypothetical protein
MCLSTCVYVCRQILAGTLTHASNDCVSVNVCVCAPALARILSEQHPAFRNGPLEEEVDQAVSVVQRASIECSDLELIWIQ